jgi:hypothetical protein
LAWAFGTLACVLALGCTVPAPESDEGGAAGATAVPTGAPPEAGGSAAPAPTTTAPAAGAAATPPAGTDTGTPPAGAAGASAGDVPIPTTPEAGSAATPPVEPMAGSAATPPPPVVDLGEGDGSDVVTIGDSWMNYIISGGGIEGALSRAGKSYAGYGVAGTTLLSGQIPGQYTSAKRTHPNISTVIMTGGGNDIMFSGGCNTPEACEKSVQALSDGLNELWTTMSNDGVKDVVYIRYSKGAGTTNTANLPTTPPTPPVICTTGPIRCTSMDTTDAVMDQLIDGIHPAPAANDRIVEKLLMTMEMKGIRR